jgi:hypothetical protein
MTEAEARIFLGVTEEIDAHEGLEEQLFQFKQFFTSKPIIGATFYSRLEKLRNIRRAAEVLGLGDDGEESVKLEKLKLTGNILADFLSFQGVKSDWMLEIHRTYSPGLIEKLVLEILDQMSDYEGMWQDTGIPSESVILSKEPDPMDLLADIKHANEAGIMTYSDLANDLTDRFGLAKKESMRLFLLHKREEEWKKHL